MTGDNDDILSRLKRLLPTGWFGADGGFPIVEALLSAPAWAFGQIYILWLFAKLQTRLATMTGGWLDFAAADYFTAFRRFGGEGDASYSRRIRLEVLRDRNTRHAIDRAIYDLTGTHPDIYEPWRPGDCGGYGSPALAYGAAGRYGSRTARCEVLITTPYPQNFGIPNVAGWGANIAAYGAPAFHYVDDNDIVGSGPTATDIINAVERVRMAGVTYLVTFSGVGMPPPNPSITTEDGFVLTNEAGSPLVLEGLS